VVPATTAPTPAPRRAPDRPAPTAARGAALILGALVLSAASLALPWALAFDPQMWLVWGRDITRLTLDTRAGPSWKPGPVLLTAPLSVLGGAAPALWLVVARTGALLALAGAWTLARRIAGPWAGAAAAGAMALSPWWLPNAALGNSEGILAASALWGVVAHLDGRRRAAVALALVAALLRPEAWPFLIGYGVWAWRADPRTRPMVALAAVAVPVLWFGPDVTGGGGALGASDAARGEPSQGSAGLTEHPVLTVLWDAVKIGGIAAFAAAVVAVAADGGRRGVVLVLALGAAAWIGLVAAMTAGGYAGNPRYLVAAAALIAVLGGVGAARIAATVRLPAAVLVLAVVVGALSVGGLRDDLRDVGVRADRRTALSRVIAAAGGRDALLRCAPVRTAGVVRGLVAWELDISPYRINAAPVAPAVVLQMRPYAGGAPDPAFATAGYRRLAAVPGWTAWGACRG
jgi:hypothetical protein